MAIDFPNSPSNNDQFTVGSTTWMYNGTAWVIVLGESSIATGAVTTDKIAASAVTSAKIAASPSLTGTPLAPTAAGGTNTTQIATTEFVTTAVSGAAITALDDVGDVTITSAASGQVLQWNGSAWINATVSSDVMTDSRNAALIIMDIGV
jgi:hypothetical protein